MKQKIQKKRNNPFIHIFSCSTGKYIYDVNTDTILKVNNDTYEFAKRGFIGNKTREVIKLEKAGYLRSNRVSITEHPMTDILPYYYEHRLNSLMLQVTQQCNLRCNYCIYSGKYNTREHSGKKMTFNLAQRGIDYILQRSDKCKDIKIGIYGGEPLLEFDLIKKCIEYTNQHTDKIKVIYAITTNGTLLNDEMIALFEKNQLELTISFDGPKNIHDKNRKYLHNDEGTYDTIMKKIEYIKKNYPKYFFNKVTFNTVISPEESYKAVIEYFKKEKIFNGNMVGLHLVDDVGRKENIDLPDEFIESYNFEYFKYLMAQIKHYKSEDLSINAKDQFQSVVDLQTKMHNGHVKCLPKKWHHGGPCIPGERAIFLNVDGNFYPCEKVSETSDLAIIGNIDNGIDLAKAQNVLNIELFTEKECKNCWAYKYCNICVRVVTDRKKARDEILKRCDLMRRTVEENLKDYCVMRALGYDFEL